MSRLTRNVLAALLEWAAYALVLLVLGILAAAVGRQWYPEMTFWQGYAIVALVAIVTMTHKITTYFIND